MLRELFGYVMVLFALVTAVGGVWAARYYSPMRQYERLRRRERRAAQTRDELVGY